MRTSVSVLGIILLGAVVLLCVAGIVAIIAAIATRKKGGDNTVVTDDNSVIGEQKSFFDGGYFQYIGRQILFFLMSVFTLGIAVPWAMCMLQRWKVSHTVINGRRLKFTGTGGQLFGKYILGVLLTIITFGIYGIWFGLSIEKWMVAHTEYADGEKMDESRFTGGAGGWFAYHVLFIVLSVITLGIGLPFAFVMLTRWRLSNTVIGGSPLVFEGSGGKLFGKFLLWGLLSVVTLGIFDLFVSVKYMRWETAYTQALYRTKEYKKAVRAFENNVLNDVSMYNIAANNTELQVVRSGITGNETTEEIKEKAENGNIYAAYMYACDLSAQSNGQSEDAVEMLRVSAYGGYHPAILEYAYIARNYNEQEFVSLVEEAAKNGNFAAAVVLKDYYEGLAHQLKQANNTECIHALEKAVYWFKVAICQGSYANSDPTYEYEKMLDTIALWKAATIEPKKGGAGVVVGAILGVLALAAVLGVGIFMIMAVFGVTTMNLGMVKESVGAVEPMPYEEFTYYDDTDDYVDDTTEDNYGYVHYLTGLTEESAVELLEDEGFSYDINYTETMDYGEDGIVISCSHPEGSYSKDDTIEITVARVPEYPELTEAEAFRLIDSCNTACTFLQYYFDEKGMLDEKDTYEIPVFDGSYTETCYAIKGVYTREDLKKALSEDFTDKFIEDEFMKSMYFDDAAGLEIYKGIWIEVDGRIYCIPNYGMGFYGMDRDTLSMEHFQPGRYRVICNGGVPEPEYYGQPDEITAVYEDGSYKIDNYYIADY